MRLIHTGNLPEHPVDLVWKYQTQVAPARQLLSHLRGVISQHPGDDHEAMFAQAFAGGVLTHWSDPIECLLQLAEQVEAAGDALCDHLKEWSHHVAPDEGA